MAKPRVKKFNIWMQLFVQGSALVVELIVGYLGVRFSPELAAELQPHIGDIMGSVHGMILVYGVAKVKVKNMIRAKESE